MRDESGQSTLEYAIILCTFLAMVTTLFVLWHAARSGLFIQSATDATSHVLRSEFAKTLKDVLLY